MHNGTWITAELSSSIWIYYIDQGNFDHLRCLSWGKGHSYLTLPHLRCRRHETQVWSLGQKDPLEEGMATHSSTPAWRISGTEEPSGLQSIGSHRVKHDKQLWCVARNDNNSDNNSNTTANIFCITLCVIHSFSTTHRLSYWAILTTFWARHSYYFHCILRKQIYNG